MTEVLISLTRFRNEHKQLTTGNQISLSDVRKFILPSRDIICQETLKQSTKQYGDRKEKRTTDVKPPTSTIIYNRNHGLEARNRIELLVCFTLLLLPCQTTAAINCR